MQTIDLQPFSPNWNQIKHEFVRNLEVFETLRKATKDKDTIKQLDSIIANNKECSKAMELIEKSPDVFKDTTKPVAYKTEIKTKEEPPNSEPDESLEE